MIHHKKKGNIHQEIKSSRQKHELIQIYLRTSVQKGIRITGHMNT
jgi:hypothetical protein